MKTCLYCGKEFEPDEKKTMKIYTCCARFWLCEECSKRNIDEWDERMKNYRESGKK